MYTHSVHVHSSIRAPCPSVRHVHRVNACYSSCWSERVARCDRKLVYPVYFLPVSSLATCTITRDTDDVYIHIHHASLPLCSSSYPLPPPLPELHSVALFLPILLVSFSSFLYSVKLRNSSSVVLVATPGDSIWKSNLEVNLGCRMSSTVRAGCVHD